jgi:hypothetical protein
MNLTKALKHKKKLIKLADEHYVRFSKFNSTLAGAEAPYNAEQAFLEWLRLTDELVELKAKIHIANGPIMEKIHRMSELKNMIHRFRNVDTKSGMHREYYENNQLVEYTAFFDVVKKDTQIYAWEGMIEELQEEIEAYNATTKI